MPVDYMNNMNICSHRSPSLVDHSSGSPFFKKFHETVEIILSFFEWTVPCEDPLVISSIYLQEHLSLFLLSHLSNSPNSRSISSSPKSSRLYRSRKSWFSLTIILADEQFMPTSAAVYIYQQDTSLMVPPFLMRANMNLVFWPLVILEERFMRWFLRGYSGQCVLFMLRI